MGNNEFDGPWGPAWRQNTAFTNYVCQPLLRFVGRFRTVRALSTIYHRYVAPDPAAVNPVDYFDNLSTVCHGSPSRQKMLRAFERNINTICAAATRAGAQVILCSVGVNLKDWPPFASRNCPVLPGDQQASWDNFFGKGRDLVHAEAWEDAQEALEAAKRIDAHFAALHFLLGKCNLALGDKAQALDAFQQATNFDCYPYRTDGAMNAVIERVATERSAEDVFFVDIMQRLNEASEDGVVGNGFFYDNVHFLADGNYVVAQGLFEATLEVLQGRNLAVATDVALISLDDCKNLLGLCPYEHHRHLKSAMDNHDLFKQLASYEESLQDYDTEWLAQEILRVEASEAFSPEAARMFLEKALLERPGNYFLHQSLTDLLIRSGENEAALDFARGLMEKFPERPDARYFYARLLAEHGYEDIADQVMEPLTQILFSN